MCQLYATSRILYRKKSVRLSFEGRFIKTHKRTLTSNVATHISVLYLVIIGNHMYLHMQFRLTSMQKTNDLKGMAKLV